MFSLCRSDEVGSFVFFNPRKLTFFFVDQLSLQEVLLQGGQLTAAAVSRSQ